MAFAIQHKKSDFHYYKKTMCTNVLLFFKVGNTINFKMKFDIYVITYTAYKILKTKKVIYDCKDIKSKTIHIHRYLTTEHKLVHFMLEYF